MPSPPSPNAPDVDTRTFAVLTAAQIDCIRPLGHSRRARSGETLYKSNDSAAPFFVVLSGQMEVLRPTLDGEWLVAIHNPGCFTGEMTMIAGQRCWAAWTCHGTRRVSGIKQGRDAGPPTMDPIPAPMAPARFASRRCISSSGRRAD
jgi:CRP-like cAMP-binding protein